MMGRLFRKALTCVAAFRSVLLRLPRHLAHPFRWTLRLVILACLAAALVWGWLAFRLIAEGQDPAVRLAELSVTLRPNRPVEIDRVALGQVRPDSGPGFAAAALEYRTGAGATGVFLRNAAREGRLLLDYGSGRISADRWRLAEGAEAHLPNGMVLRFIAVGPAGFDLVIPGRDGAPERRYRYEAARRAFAPVAGKENAFAACLEPETLRERLSAWSGRLASAVKAVLEPVHALLTGGSGGERLIASLGGSRDCAEGDRPHVSLERLPWRMLRLAQRAEAFYLAPDRGGARSASSVRLQAPDGAVNGFADLSWPVEGLAEAVIGPTGYDVSLTRTDASARIVLVPRERVTLLHAAAAKDRRDALACPETEAAPPRDACLRWSAPFRLLERLSAEGFGGLEPGQQGLRLAIGLLPLLVSIMAAPLRRLYLGYPGPGSAGGGRLRFRSAVFGKDPREPAWFRPRVLILFSTLLALVDPSPLGLDPMAAVFLNWWLAGLAVAFSPAGLLMGLFWLAVALMAVMGVLNLAGMAVDGGTDSWADHFVKHKLLFLDLLPPFVIALAVAPPRALRPYIHGFAAGTDIASRLARWGPTSALLMVLVIWAAFGAERGIAGFQPVEAGKFATALLCASLVATFDGAARGREGGAVIRAQLISLALLGLFLGFLLGAPVVQSDFSPALIIILLALTIGGVYLALRLLAYLYATARRVRERRRVPRAFMPVFLMPRTERRVAAGLICGLFGLGVFLGFGAKPLLRWGGLQIVGLEEWPQTTDRQLAELGRRLGLGVRIPTERIIAWIDLDFDRFRLQRGPAAAAYRDLEYQVIRSRAVIAGARCGFAPPLRMAAEAVPFARLDLWAREASVLFDRWTGWSRRNAALCAPRPAKPSEDGGKARHSLFDGEPIEIPVVQFDFAASYLIGRFGLGAAALLYAAQALAVLIALTGVARLAFAGGGDRADRTVRWFLAVLVAGSIALFVLHWLISWSNILGLLPVMGQPMTWLSAATSHHLFMALPAVLAIFLGLHYGVPDTRRVEFRVPPVPRKILSW